MNSMKLAWILFRGNKLNYTFRYCLKIAWKLIKKAKVVYNHYMLKIRSKELSNLATVLEVKENIIYIKDYRDYNLLFYFLKYL